MWDATLRPHMRVPKKRGTRSEANEVQIEESAPRDGRNPLDRPRTNIRANSFGRGPQRDTPAAWIVRCPAAVSSSPSPHVEMESKRESGELWKRPSREILSRVTANERERGSVSFLERRAREEEEEGIDVTGEDKGRRRKLACKNFEPIIASRFEKSKCCIVDCL